MANRVYEFVFMRVEQPNWYTRDHSYSDGRGSQKLTLHLAATKGDTGGTLPWAACDGSIPLCDDDEWKGDHPEVTRHGCKKCKAKLAKSDLVTVRSMRNTQRSAERSARGQLRRDHNVNPAHYTTFSARYVPEAER